MNMRSLNRKVSYLPLAALILSGSGLVAAPSVSAVGPPVVQSQHAQESDQASELLKEIQSIARDLDRDAATLESYKLRGLSWQSHAYQLTMAKQHINAVGSRVEKLQALRSSSAPWQQRAIDTITPVAVQLASRTEDAINHLNESRHELFAPTYTNHLSAIAINASQMKQSVEIFLDLARTQEKLDNLHERIAGMES
jgi:hypothetical protein